MGSRNLTVDHAMLAIKSVDPDASLRYSEYTQRWYVCSRIEVSDGAVLKGGSEHECTPEDAVYAFLDSLIGIGLDEVVVGRSLGERRNYRWNGAAFAEVPAPTRREDV